MVESWRLKTNSILTGRLSGTFFLSFRGFDLKTYFSAFSTPTHIMPHRSLLSRAKPLVTTAILLDSLQQRIKVCTFLNVASAVFTAHKESRVWLLQEGVTKHNCLIACIIIILCFLLGLYLILICDSCYYIILKNHCVY